MRVEVYGCRWSDGIVSYSMPQGDKKGGSWEFYDFTYDGHWDGEKLKYGKLNFLQLLVPTKQLIPFQVLDNSQTVK